MLARADDQRELRRACAHFRDCARADGTEPREHDGLTISAGLRRADDLPGGAVLDRGRDRRDRDPRAHRPARPTATPAPRPGAGPTPSSGWPSSPSPNLRGHDPDGPARALPACSIVIDWTTLTGETWGRIDGDYTGTLHHTDVERLLCDCTVSRVVTGPDGLPLDVGRSRRTIPPQLRRALAVRDHGCRYPGCTRPHGWTRAHHVIHWKDGGPTVLDQPRVALRPPPSRRAPARLDREVRRPHLHRLPTRRHRSHLTRRGPRSPSAAARLTPRRGAGDPYSWRDMEFRRIHALPPYAFAEIDALKMAARRAGEDVIDLGFGNPDVPSPQIAVEKLAEAARNPRNHRYSATRGVPAPAPRDHRPLQAEVRRRARPRDAGVRHHRRQGGVLPPHVGAARPGGHRARAEPVATRSTSGVRSSPAPACTTCAWVRARTSSPTCTRRGSRRGRDRVWW